MEIPGIHASDWQELLMIGEDACKAWPTNLEHWQKVSYFVLSYSGLAKAFQVFEFESPEHEAWCDRINALTRERIDQKPQSHVRSARFSNEYGILLGDNVNSAGWIGCMVKRVKNRVEKRGLNAAGRSMRGG